MPQQDELKFGAHNAHFEPPDTLVVSFNGLINMDDVKRTSQLYRETFERHGQYYCIADIGRSQIDNAGRKYLSDNGRSEWFHAVIYVGADVVQRTFGKAIALAMLFTGKTSFETVFVATLDEARAWVTQHRSTAAQRKAG
ncbi:STAS/SEC14 domain-containing protein [Pyxidicoccus fallax]|uniref:STAS/SEC14 domain-containing protein n=1 Tax=Pyxidicoccus fallax TaxID=394095 RepID=A0A848LTU3_9BACT|nr:STAS/SEC14 domain-containing protein [Pyxidicoccus fallax]NMO21408.1 STAS/SEC14 domain-containing protein [Pyxidicoccus fallax]NPC84899.1 STAS/SEC14 domain-containing protein [Pyxidicoccus fallax]